MTTSKKFLATLLVSAFCAGTAFAATFNVALSGLTEVPPVKSEAKGSAAITIGDDGAVSGSVTVTGMTATAAHIHEAAAGANGPVIVPFEADGANKFKAAAGAKLTPAQMTALKAGNLYVNVHSKEHPGGEVRGQIK